MTPGQLKLIMPLASQARVDTFVLPLTDAMREFDIDTPCRKAAFLAQVAHESGQLRWLKELASGEAYDTGRLAERLGNTPEADGDGQRYKGRGLIQVTGRANYLACGNALGLLLIARPELLEQPIHAARSAAWFWKSRGLNELADQGAFTQITRRINGGTKGLNERLAFYELAKEVLGC